MSYKKISIDEKLKTLNNEYISQIIYNKKHKHTGLKGLKITPQSDEYHYEIFNAYQNTLIGIKEKLNELYQKLGITQSTPYIKNVYSGLTRGVARYITSNFKTRYKISNGFVKLWEIYTTSRLNPLVINNETHQINTFHMCEAPGQWIHATDHYIYSNLVNKRITNNVNYNWFGNALNPYNPENIKRFGNELFEDDYGFIGKYRDRWLYGPEDTGDITKSKNIKWMRNFINEKYNTDTVGNLQLITGDGGIHAEASLEIMQRLDIAQCFMTLACSQKGSNCIIKLFLPFISSIPKSYTSSGLYINIFYCYCVCFEKIEFLKPNTSNPHSGEFYIVGKNFLGIDEKQLDLLLKHLDNHTDNETWFAKDDLDEKIVSQILKFMTDLMSFNATQKDIIYQLNECLLATKKRDSKMIVEKKCKKYMNKTYTDNMLEKGILQWVKKTGFN